MANKTISDLWRTFRSFFRSGKGFEGVEGTTPVDSAASGVRRIYPKTTGWYDQDSTNREESLAWEVYPCDETQCSKMETVLHDQLPKRVFILPPQHKIVHVDVYIETAMSGLVPTGDSSRGSSQQMSSNTYVVSDWKLTNGATIGSISAYSDGNSGTIKFKLCKQVDTTHFDISDISGNLTHNGAGEQTFTITPVVIPGSGDYYIGFYANFGLFYSQDSNRSNRRDTGDLSGNNQSFYYTDWGMKIKVSYAAFAQLGTETDADAVLADIDVGGQGATISEDVDFGPFHAKVPIIFTGPEASDGEVEVTCTYSYVNTNAADVTVDASGFSGVLSSSDDDVQAALNTLDDHTHDAANNYFPGGWA